MRDAIEKFLRDRRTVVPFAELAARFFKIENLTPLLAEQLLAPVLENAHHISKENEGYVYVGDDAPAEFLLVQLAPFQTAHFSHVKYVHLYNQQTREMRVFHFQDDLKIIDIEQLYSCIQGSRLIFNGQGNQLSTLNRMLAEINRQVSHSINFIHLLKSALGADDISKNQFDYYSCFHVESELPDILFHDFIDRFHDFIQIVSLPIDELLRDDRRYPNFDGKKFDSEILATLSNGPGVYVMRTKTGQVFYVGKAKNLHTRVNSYFQPRLQVDDKVQAVWEHVDSIEIRHCGSELEALLLEQKLFDELQPQLNIVRNVHSRQKLQKQRYPRILIFPAVEPDRVQVYFMNPGFLIDVLDVDRNRVNQKELAACIQHTFFSELDPIEDEREELIISWLAGTDRHVAGIDMRTVSSPEKALQLTLLNIQQFSDDDAVIFRL